MKIRLYMDIYQGFDSKYLVEGLVGLAEYLRGDKARYFVQSLKHE